jgi:Tol biopolymer transport system component
MGEVYRVRDERLERDAALKILPEAFAVDHDRVVRFQRESRATAALNHPNIVAIYDVGVFENRPYLVTELLDGQTLRSLLQAVQLSTRRAAEVGAAVARGLAAAHARGILHRDLKPENVFVSRDGRVTILDFGLAKLVEPPDTTPTHTHETTTDPHVVMGTVGYMSPEQARGLALDERSDIFALGAMLYELFSGQRAFTGTTRADVLSAVIRAEPPPIDDPARVPVVADRIIRRCLEKEPDARFRAASDLAFALENLTPASTASGAPAPASEPVRAGAWGPWMLAATMAGAAFAAGWLLRPAPPRSAPAQVSFTIQADPSLRWPVSVGVPSIAVAPDGLAIAFSVPGGTRPLMYRPFAEAVARELRNTAGATSPFFSPDGAWIGYYLDGALRRISIASDATATITPVRDLRGAVWTDNDHIIYAALGAGLWRVRASGGAPELLVEPPANGQWAWPSVLEGGRTVLISQRSAFGMEAGSIHAIALDTKSSREVIGNASDPAYANGRLYFGRGDALWSVPFDPTTATVTGRDEVVVPGVERASGNGETQYALSSSGTLAYVPFQPRGQRQLEVLDRSGRITAVPSPPASDITAMAVSPAGDRIALRESAQLTVVGLSGQRTIRIPTLGEGNGIAWTHNGDRILYAGGTGFARVLSVRADGVGESEPVTRASSSAQDLRDTTDNGDVLFTEQGSQSSSLHLQSPTGQLTRRLITRLAVSVQISPDRKFLAYEAAGQITLQPANADDPKTQIPNGLRPVWSKDGKRIYFFSTTDSVVRVTSVPFAGGDVGEPVTHFDCERCQELDVLPAGQFAVMRSVSAPNPPATISVILQGPVSAPR